MSAQFAPKISCLSAQSALIKVCVGWNSLVSFHKLGHAYLVNHYQQNTASCDFNSCANYVWLSTISSCGLDSLFTSAGPCSFLLTECYNYLKRKNLSTMRNLTFRYSNEKAVRQSFNMWLGFYKVCKHIYKKLNWYVFWKSQINIFII